MKTSTFFFLFWEQCGIEEHNEVLASKAVVSESSGQGSSGQVSSGQGRISGAINERPHNLILLPVWSNRE